MNPISKKLEDYIRQQCRLSSVPSGTWTSVCNMKLPPPKQLVTDFIDAGDLVAVIGKSKQRKSWLLLELACHLSAGRDFLHFQIPHPVRTLGVQLEVSPDHYNRRQQMVTKGMFGSTDFIPEHITNNLTIIHGRGYGLTPADLLAYHNWYNPSVMWLDPLYLMVIESDPESHKQMIGVFQQIMRSGTTMIYVHHDKKGASGDHDLVDRGAGHSTLGRAYDCSILLDQHADDDNMQVLRTVCRNYPVIDDVSLRWEDGCFHLEDTIVPRVATTHSRNQRHSMSAPAGNYTQHACEHITDGMTKTVAHDTLREGLGVSRRQAKAIINVMLEQGTLVESTGPHNSRLLHFADIGEEVTDA